MTEKKVTQWQTFKRLCRYVVKHKWWSLLALVLLLSVSLIESTIPLVARQFIDQVTANTSQVNMSIMYGYIALYVLQSIVSYTGNIIFSKVSFTIIKDMRQDAFANMQRLSMRFFDQTPDGSIVSKITNDTEAVVNMFSGILSSLVRTIFLFSATLYTMVTLDWRLTVLVILFLPILVVCVNVYRRVSIGIITLMRQRLSDLNVKLAESIDGMRIIQAFNQEKRMRDEFKVINDEHMHYSKRFMLVDSLLLRPALSLLKLLAYALLMMYFGLTWANAGLTAGLMYAFIQYVNRLFDPLINVSQNFSTLQISMVSAGRVFQLIDETDYEPQQFGEISEVREGSIAFKNVTFSYDGVQTILDDVSFSVEKGQTIAFVGHTGSGKSSIINVLMRFYEFEKGEVLIDGQSIKQYTKSALNNAVGLVLQDPFLYYGTIESNIKMYKDLSHDTIEQAAKFVDAHDFITQLPNGYQEPVTQRGSSLSTGQRQLVSFARVMASDPKILILDEATANIDSETEEIIQSSLKKMRHGRTTIAVAHRLSTIQDADCIYVLDKGKIIESGTHEQLIAQQGTYHTMYMLQSKK